MTTPRPSIEGEYAAGRPKSKTLYERARQLTYSGTPLVAAAAIAQLEILKTGEVQRELNRKGDRLRAGLNQVLKTRGVRGCVYGAASIFRIFLGADAQELGLEDWTLDAARLDRGMGATLAGALHLAMLIHGVDLSRTNASGWTNGAMTEADIDFMIDAFDRSLGRMQEERLLA
jgi:glutamate-1-semialdehyde aminotransferase